MALKARLRGSRIMRGDERVVGSRRTLCLAVVVGLSAAGLVACGDDQPAPDVAAGALAKGLSSFDLSAVPFTGVTSAEVGQKLSSAVEGMGDLRPKTSVKSIRIDKDANVATAVLSLTWDVDGSDEDWAYTTTAQLTYREDVWSVGWSPAVLEPSLSAGQRLVVRKLAAKRGEILGAGGDVLVTDRPVVRVGIDRTKVAAEQAAASAHSLASLLDVDPAAFAQRVAAAGPKAFVEALVLRTDGPNTPDSPKIAAIPGAVEIPDELPLAPTREFARPILGTVGAATAELIGKSKGRLSAGDTAGLSGLQQSHDEQLRGQAGVMVEVVPPEGSDGKAREVFRRAPAPGQPVTTTLDPALQIVAEGLLTPVKSASAIVALRPSTGEVLAAASGPGGQGYSTATLGRYAPGSVFKVVSTLGLLRGGLTPASVIPCTRSTTVDGRSFKNYDDYPASALGDIPLRSAVANSCNTALIAARDRVPQAALTEAAAALGLGLERDLGVPFFAGSVPAQAGETEHAASMIGQGRIQASPLGMAVVAASIAQGKAVVPRLLQGGPSNTAKAGQQVGSAEASELRAMMRAVVTGGSATFLGDVPGEAVAAKTGTAEYGTELPPRTHAWMIAIQGDLAVAVFVEDGAGGSRTAGPIIEQFLRGTP